MAHQKKVSLNIDDDLLREIDHISVNLSHSSRSQTIQYLLKKAVYQEKEKIIGSTVELFIKEGSDKLSQKLSEENSFVLEELFSNVVDQINSKIKRSEKLALASFITISNAVASTEEEANEIREEAIKAAYSIEDL